jgi:glucokinase
MGNIINAVTLCYEIHRTPGTLIFTKNYQNTHFGTFAEVLRGFLTEAGVADKPPPITACIACAGPVSNNSVTMTNRDGWVITGADIKRVFGIQEVSLINDFLAVGYGLMSLESKELVVLQVRGDYHSHLACCYDMFRLLHSTPPLRSFLFFCLPTNQHTCTTGCS